MKGECVALTSRDDNEDVEDTVDNELDVPVAAYPCSQSHCLFRHVRLRLTELRSAISLFILPPQVEEKVE